MQRRAARRGRIEEGCELGTCLDVSGFTSGASGVAEGFELAGPKDFPQGGYELRVQDGLQISEILPGAPTNGDAGIVKTFAAAPGQEYSAHAEARLVTATGGFKARLTIAARQRGGRQLQEFNDRLEAPSPDFGSMEVPSAVMPEGTELVTVKFRAHTKSPGAAGVTELKRLVFARKA